MTKTISYLIIFSLTFSPVFFYITPAQAHKGHDNHIHGQKSSENPDSAEALLDAFHHDVEHGEDGEASGFFKEWLSKFNFLKVGLDTHRWIQMKYITSKDKSEYVRNLPVMGGMYLMSHMLEMSSGPVGVYTASSLGLPHSAQVVIGTIGAIISVPGLDPICMILFAASPTKTAQKIMSNIRIFSVRLAKAVNDKTHLDLAIKSILSKTDRVQEIIKGSSSEDISVRYIYEQDKDQLIKELNFLDQDKPYLKLTVRTDKGVSFVESLLILNQKIYEANQEKTSELLKKFNLSVRYALNRSLNSRGASFYSQKSSLEGGFTEILFKKFSLVLKPKIRLKSPFNHSCSSLFI